MVAYPERAARPLTTVRAGRVAICEWFPNACCSNVRPDRDGKMRGIVTVHDLRSRLGGPLRAMLTAAVVLIGFDLGLAVARGWRPDAGYSIAMAGLCLAVAIGVGMFGALVGQVAAALAIWVALEANVGLLLFASGSWWLSLTAGAVTYAGATWVGRAGGGPELLGIVTAATLTLSGQLLGRLLPALGVDRPEGAGFDVVLLFSVLGTWLACLAYLKLRSSIRRMPPAEPVVLAVMAGVLLLVPLTIGGADAQAHVRVGGTRVAPNHPPRTDAQPNILVLVLDTVRADHLSAYGYKRDTTPNLRRFLDANTYAERFPMAFAPASWTLPSHASLFSGLLPSSHGLHAGGLRDLRNPLNPDFRMHAKETLAERMRSYGYRTAAVVANVHLTIYPGIERGFEQFVNPPAVGTAVHLGESLRARFWPNWYAHLLKPYPPASVINRELLSFLDGCGPSPCFAVANYMEAHAPYAAPPPFGGAYGDTPMDRYDEELLGLDAALGELLAALEARHFFEHGWLVITADHGESFEEHGRGQHGSSLYNEQVWIPLLVRPPSGSNIPAHRGPVSLIDVATTLAAIAGGDDAAPFGSGRDLLHIQPTGSVQIEFFGNAQKPPPERMPARAAVTQEFELIENVLGPKPELYDLQSDRRQLVNLAPQRPDELQRLTPLLPPLLDEAVAHEDRSVAERVGRKARAPSEEQVEKLRALGYVQ